MNIEPVLIIIIIIIFVFLINFAVFVLLLFGAISFSQESSFWLLIRNKYPHVPMWQICWLHFFLQFLLYSFSYVLPTIYIASHFTSKGYVFSFIRPEIHLFFLFKLFIRNNFSVFWYCRIFSNKQVFFFKNKIVQNWNIIRKCYFSI